MMKKGVSLRVYRARGAGFLILLAVFMCVGSPLQAIPTDYMLYENHGGMWSDAEKSNDNSEDDAMCWAATASNMLDWTGWGNAGGMTDTDEMFGYFQDHWTDEGSMMEDALDWWFDGSNITQGTEGWAQVDVAGGGFYPDENFGDYYHGSSDDSLAMVTIDEYLHAGYGTGVGVYGPGGHALTIWGYRYGSSEDDYLGIWVSDSDDDKNGVASRAGALRYYDVANSGNKWYLQDYFGSDSWYIGEIQGLELIPEPATILLLSLGSLVLHRRRS